MVAPLATWPHSQVTMVAWDVLKPQKKKNRKSVIDFRIPDSTKNPPSPPQRNFQIRKIPF